METTTPQGPQTSKSKTSFRFKVLVGVGLLCLAAWALTLYTLFHYAFK